MPRHAGRALVVEDNPDVAKATAAMLIELGYGVDVASDAEKAIDLISAVTFDLVLTDVVMPGAMNGIELANRLRDTNPKIAVVVMSGYFESAGLSAPRSTVLRKPFDVAALAHAIENAIVEAQLVP